MVTVCVIFMIESIFIFSHWQQQSPIFFRFFSFWFRSVCFHFANSLWSHCVQVYVFDWNRKCSYYLVLVCGYVHIACILFQMVDLVGFVFVRLCEKHEFNSHFIGRSYITKFSFISFFCALRIPNLQILYLACLIRIIDNLKQFVYANCCNGPRTPQFNNNRQLSQMQLNCTHIDTSNRTAMPKIIVSRTVYVYSYTRTLVHVGVRYMNVHIYCFFLNLTQASRPFKSEC